MDAAWKMPPLILMTLKNTTHPHHTPMGEMLYSTKLGPVVSWNTIITRMPRRPEGSLWFFQILKPPETLFAEFLDTGLGAGTAGGGRGWRGLGQRGCRHIILLLQGLHNTLEASLLLSEIMLHTGEEIRESSFRGSRQGWGRGSGSTI